MADTQHTRIASALPQDVSSIQTSRRLFLTAGAVSDDPIFAPVADLERATAEAKAAETASDKGNAHLKKRIKAFEKAERDCRKISKEVAKRYSCVRELEDAFSDASIAELGASLAVIQSKPTTRAGAIAQLRILAPRLDDDIPADAIIETAGETIRCALDLIEGETHA